MVNKPIRRAPWLKAVLKVWPALIPTRPSGFSTTEDGLVACIPCHDAPVVLVLANETDLTRAKCIIDMALERLAKKKKAKKA